MVFDDKGNGGYERHERIHFRATHHHGRHGLVAYKNV